MNAVKGLLGGDEKAHAEAEVEKHAKKASKTASDDISKALESLRKSGEHSSPLLSHMHDAVRL